MHKYNEYTRFAAVFMHSLSVADLFRIAGVHFLLRNGAEDVHQFRIQLLSGNGYVEFIILLKRDDFMPREESIAGALIVNILLGCIWHFITYIVCISVDDSFYDADKKMYQPHKWERNGRFYSDVLKINRWKDHLPQYVGKDGFSKDHLEEVSVSYLDRFIMETCRA